MAVRCQAIDDQLMSDVPDGPTARFVSVGSSSDLVRLLAEYGVEDSDVEALTRARIPVGVGGAPRPAEYLVHESVLRSHGEFPCAGDGEALRHWSAAPAGDGPRVWIVGKDLLCHEAPEFWAHDIYYRPDSRWWVPGTAPTPLPPP